MVNIAGYHGFYIQKENGNVRESNAEWNILVKRIDWGMIALKPKGYAETDFPDQNGKDVFVPQQLKFQSGKIKIEFLYKGEYGTFGAQLSAFENYLAAGGSFKMQDKFAGAGRQGVRWTDSEAPKMIARNQKDGDIYTFVFHFEIDDPVTNITLA